MQDKSHTEDFNSLLQLLRTFDTEEKCRVYLEKLRWEGKPKCVKCGCERVGFLKKQKRYKCYGCRKQYGIRVGTIFEDSKLPLQLWFAAIYLLTSHKKGISSVQLAKDLGVTQKTAWFMLHRLRYAVRTKSFNMPLEGTIEIDETFLGGKEKNKHKNKRTKGTQGRSVKTKQPVLGMIERGGRIVTLKVADTSGPTLLPEIIEKVSKDAKVMTDEWTGYKKLGGLFKEHQVVNHGKEEYVVGDAHTNTIESFWSLLKRGLVGIYHKMSVKHLDKYLDEFQFRFNSRDISEGARIQLFLSDIDGRLSYEGLIAKEK